jgi:hypothetical protein
LQLLERLLLQAILTLKLLCGSRINPKLSAHAKVFGQYSYTTTLIATSGTHILVHKKSNICLSWAPHAFNAAQHYQCYRTYVWATDAMRISKPV